jgi:hypothetical protein
MYGTVGPLPSSAATRDSAGASKRPRLRCGPRGLGTRPCGLRGHGRIPGAGAALLKLKTLTNGMVPPDRLAELEEATRLTLTSMAELAINDSEIDFLPVLRQDDFDGVVTRINVDLWERPERTKDALQELATQLAKAFQTVAGEERRVKVVIRPYDVERSGRVSL